MPSLTTGTNSGFFHEHAHAAATAWRALRLLGAGVALAGAFVAALAAALLMALAVGGVLGF
ncbi:MAG: hypothetical protein EXQ93_05430 [Alphaproteobacteria bacterium]|nr:hypothetical protein [Alphaproteobacteria bacterium]